MNLSRESIFTSSIRSLFNAFFSLIGLVIGIAIAGAVYMMASSKSSSMPKTQFSIEADADGNRDLLVPTAPVILKINISGVIGDKKLNADAIQSQLFDSRDGLLKNDRVKGILLFVDTPGGGVTDSNAIYEALLDYKEKYKIPIYAFVDGMCASGGMYVTSAADKIYASSVSVIGSVGVILGPAFNFFDLMQKYGVQSKIIARGKDKAMLNPFTQWTKDQGSSLEPVCDYLYQHFVDLVANARKGLDKDKLVSEYGAQVYSSPKAQQLGFIEEANTNYSTAVRDLALAAGIKEDEKYQVVQLNPVKMVLSDFFDGQSFMKTGKIEHQVKWSQYQLDQLTDPFLYLYQL